MSEMKLTDKQFVDAIERFPIMAQWGRNGIEEFAELLQYQDSREQLHDEALAFNHANEVVGKYDADNEALRQRIAHLEILLDKALAGWNGANDKRNDLLETIRMERDMRWTANEPPKVKGNHRFMAGTCVDCGKPLDEICSANQ